jgi:hypothetical protein
MANWKKTVSTILYCMALLVSVGGTAWIVSLHFDIWSRGKFFLGSMSGPVMVEYVIVSAALWLIARFLYKIPRLNRAFYLVTAIPFLMMILIPGRFGLGDL